MAMMAPPPLRMVDSTSLKSMMMLASEGFNPSPLVVLESAIRDILVSASMYLLKAILEQAAGAKVGLIGTNQNMIGNAALPTDRTTPESFEVQKLFREMADAGCTHVVMETSSHALYLDRVYGVHYDVGVFTNLTQDHLDFHKTMESYCDAKAILFRNCSVGVVNADDPS